MNKTAKRRALILEELDKIGQVNVAELSEILSVSEVTIRNDLANLEKNNLLIRAHGGAFKTNNLVLTVNEKKKINLDAKRLIGKTAASLIHEDESIILDSGSTTIEISNNISHFKRLSVITNALDIVNNLANNKNIELLMLGGYLKDFSMSLVGPIAEQNLRQMHCNKFFLGIDGINQKTGVFTHYMEEAHLNQIMIEISEEVIVVADSTKLKKRGHALICGFDKIHKFITDDKIEKSDREMLENYNIEVIIAK
ncbi:transcriptional repressor AgaR [Mariniflexile sp. HMF6888]|uniref:transcriptional repressor AgaR n=1 Tax=Mariniflexile sp. HMF6888 TaxID=3373086 RepID=UPI003796F491